MPENTAVGSNQLTSPEDREIMLLADELPRSRCSAGFPGLTFPEVRPCPVIGQGLFFNFP